MGHRHSKSSIVSGSGIAHEIIRTLSNRVEDLGGSDRDLRRLLRHTELLDEVADLVIASGRRTGAWMRLVVNQDYSLQEAIASAEFDDCHPVYSEVEWDDWHEGLLPPLGDEEDSFRLVRFDLGTLSMDEVIQELKRLNLRPASLRELIEVSKAYPEIRDKGEVVALGSILKRAGCTMVPRLTRGIPESHRHLGIMSLGERASRLDITISFLAASK
ncbi:MAG: hypothetical protein M3N59_00480 [bacterium]|nr:hypothetical protein [bacterium]